MILREEGPYFVCMRCQHKVPISMMEWDGGLLVCSSVSGLYCSADGAINGAFELRTAKEAGINKHEWEPEPKLINQTDPAQELENLPASAGMSS